MIALHGPSSSIVLAPRDGLFDKTISIPRLIHTRTSEYRSAYRTSSAA